MKTKFFVLVLCLSFAVLILASGTILVQKGMCQGVLYGSTVSGLNAQDYGWLNMGQGWPIGSVLVQTANWQGQILSGVMYNLARGPDISRPTFPWTNSVQESRGVQMAGYYSPDLWINSLIGVGDYMQGLQFGSPSSSITVTTAFGFPASNYNYDYSKLDTQLFQYNKFGTLPKFVETHWKAVERYPFGYPGY